MPLFTSGGLGLGLKNLVLLISLLGSQPAGGRSHKPDGRLPLLSARRAVTSPAAEHHRPLPGTILYCLMTEAHVCKQLAQACAVVCILV